MRSIKAFARVALGVALSMTAGFAAAQGNDAPVQAEQACELHIWPSSGLRSVYYGWFHAGIVDGAVTGRQGYPPVPKDPLPSALQVELMDKFGVPHALGLPAY